MTQELEFASVEIATLWGYLCQTMDRMTAVAEEVTPAELHWQPPAPDTNSIAVLIVHTLGNIDENLISALAGGTFERNRDAEFVERELTGTELTGQWHALRERLERALAPIQAEVLAETRHHPRRGTITGRDLLLVALTHAREHLGQAELTRDLARAASS